MELRLEAILLCGKIKGDIERSRDVCLERLLNTVPVSAFPTTVPIGACLFVSVAGIRRPLVLRLLIEHFHTDDADKETVRDEPLAFPVPDDPRLPTYAYLYLEGLPLPGPGEYRIQLWNGSTLFGEKRLFAELHSESQPPKTIDPNDPHG